MDNEVLFLTTWYPSKNNPLSGIFVKKHAEAISRHYKIVILAIIEDNNISGNRFNIDLIDESNIYTIKVTYRKIILKNLLFKNFLKLINIFIGFYLGYRFYKSKFNLPNMIHANIALPSGFIALIFKKLKGINYIITEHSSDYTSYDGSYDNSSFIRKYISKKIFKNAAAITAVSDFLAASLDKRFSLGSRVINITNIVKNHKPLDIKRDDNIINFITLSLLNDTDKNITGLIRTFKKLVLINNKVRLHILGNGQDEEILKKLANNLELDKYITFHGYIPNDQLHNYFKFAHCFVLNSNYETFSVATAESLSFGVPVIVTKCGGPEEFVTKDVGILVERKDDESLLKGLIYMVENWDKYDPEKLREYAISKFSDEVVGENFRSLYDSILKK